MSDTATITTCPPSIAQARAKRDEAQRELAALAERIGRLEVQEFEQANLLKRHTARKAEAILAGEERLPAAPVIDADIGERRAVLTKRREELEEALAAAKGRYRRAVCDYIEGERARAIKTYEQAAKNLVDAWQECMEHDLLLETAGVRRVLSVLFSDQLKLPLAGDMRPPSKELLDYFNARYQTEVGLSRQVQALRARMEAQIGERLPW